MTNDKKKKYDLGNLDLKEIEPSGVYTLVSGQCKKTSIKK